MFPSLECTQCEIPAEYQAQHIGAEEGGLVGPVVAGSIKSFNQKSGWGFIQLSDDEQQAPNNSKDVFFHRADVIQIPVGNSELRPSSLVNCRVLTTSKGEKASEICVIDDGQSEGECEDGAEECTKADDVDSAKKSRSNSPTPSDRSDADVLSLCGNIEDSGDYSVGESETAEAEQEENDRTRCCARTSRSNSPTQSLRSNQSDTVLLSACPSALSEGDSSDTCGHAESCGDSSEERETPDAEDDKTPTEYGLSSVENSPDTSSSPAEASETTSSTTEFRLSVSIAPSASNASLSSFLQARNTLVDRGSDTDSLSCFIQPAISKSSSGLIRTCSFSTTATDGSHCPYGELDFSFSPACETPKSPTYPSYKSSRTNFIGWECTSCNHPNVVQSILRVMVVCEPCGSPHHVDSWYCGCTHTNNRDSRFCGSCEVPYAQGCMALYVQPHSAAGEDANPMVLATGHQQLQRKSRPSGWERTSAGWVHPSIGAPSTSNWCRNNYSVEDLPSMAHGHPTGAEHLAMLFQKCQAQLFWARDWMLKGAPCNPEDEILSKAWLYRFSEEVCNPKHQLVCPTRGYLSFAPNPCVNIEDPEIQQMYRAIGMALAMAMAIGCPLHPMLPSWLGRVLLGCPTTSQDLQEFDPQLHQMAENMGAHANVESIKASFTQDIERYGVTKTFEYSSDVSAVTEDNQHLFGAWMKELYLNKSIAVQLENLKTGFFDLLSDNSLLCTLTPVSFCNTINGERAIDVTGMRKALKMCPMLRTHQPELRKWIFDTVMYLSARQWQLLLRFVTGIAKAPCGGLDALEHPITIKCDPNLPVDSLPQSDKTQNVLILPQYSGAGDLRQMLIMALGVQTQGFTGH